MVAGACPTIAAVAQKPKRKATEKSNGKQTEGDTKQNEKSAEHWLNKAKGLEASNPGYYRAYLRKTLKDFPGTKAAAEAKQLLEKEK